ncbi:MAG: hypothetical protein HQ464_14365 [Planctomycetes bacterium]|nr:hypothetical protein [Planctomycetota bacterium]
MDDFLYGQLRNLPLLERPDEVGHTPALIGAVSAGRCGDWRGRLIHLK